MPDALALALLLNAADDHALAAAVFAAGGIDAAIRLLFDAACQLQIDGGASAEIMTIVAVSDRVAALARKAR